MADHCASILRPRRCACPHPTSFEQPVSDRPPRRPLCDCLEHAQNFTATMVSMAMSERPILGRPRQPFGLPSAFNGDLASFVVAQGRHKGHSPCVKGVLVLISVNRGGPGVDEFQLIGDHLSVKEAPGVDDFHLMATICQ